MAALKLLEVPDGPVLEDFPEEAPISNDTVVALACPVDFTQPEPDLNGIEKLCDALAREIKALRPWYERSLETSGRTTVGVSGIALDDMAGFICSFFENDAPISPHPELSAGYVLNLAIDDLKAYYSEGLTSQPGQASPDSQTVSDWFWSETTASKVLFRLAEKLSGSEDGMMQIVGNVLTVPVHQKHRTR